MRLDTMTDTKKHRSDFVDERLDEVTEFRLSLNPETDRGCALMAAAYLDSELEQLIRKYLVDNETVKSELFAHSGPLGSFSSRIDMAYLLGLIGPKGRRDLHLIRKVRNEFGHVARPISFDEPALASRCRELYYDGIGADVSPRVKFNRVVMGVLAVVHGTTHRTKPLQEARDIDIDEKIKQRAQRAVDLILGDDA
jgi:DNA-binding MltR family transcriptional regulator